MLSNLLQELALAKDYGRKHIVLDEARLTENPVDRLSRMIRNLFWNGLTRRIDGDGLEAICADPKNRSKQRTPRIYVPIDEPEMYEYYKAVAAEKPHLNLQVDLLPRDITAEYTKSLNDKPGILALAMEKVKQEDGTTKLQGIPFVVPGARFNELYNWDSYFIALGLLIDGKVDLARGIVDHFCFEIRMLTLPAFMFSANPLAIALLRSLWEDSERQPILLPHALSALFPYRPRSSSLHSPGPVRRRSQHCLATQRHQIRHPGVPHCLDGRPSS